MRHEIAHLFKTRIHHNSTNPLFCACYTSIAFVLGAQMRDDASIKMVRAQKGQQRMSDASVEASLILC
jgi:hypothetical protein